MRLIGAFYEGGTLAGRAWPKLSRQGSLPPVLMTLKAERLKLRVTKEQHRRKGTEFREDLQRKLTELGQRGKDRRFRKHQVEEDPAKLGSQVGKQNINLQSVSFGFGSIVQWAPRSPSRKATIVS